MFYIFVPQGMAFPSRDLWTLSIIHVETLPILTTSREVVNCDLFCIRFVDPLQAVRSTRGESHTVYAVGDIFSDIEAGLIFAMDDQRRYIGRTKLPFLIHDDDAVSGGHIWENMGLRV